MNAIQRAVEIAGGQSALARAIGGTVRQGHVWYWISAARVPPEYCAAIEAVTGGQVTKHDLRPDVFGAPAEEGVDDR